MDLHPPLKFIAVTLHEPSLSGHTLRQCAAAWSGFGRMIRHQ